MVPASELTVREAQSSDWTAIWPFMKRIVAAGETFSWDRDIAEDEARTSWMHTGPGRTFVAVDDRGRVVGTAELEPNHGGPGPDHARSSQVERRESRTRGNIVEWVPRPEVVAQGGLGVSDDRGDRRQRVGVTPGAVDQRLVFLRPPQHVGIIAEHGCAMMHRMMAPDLPELVPQDIAVAGELVLSGALVEGPGDGPVRPPRIRLRESEVRGVTIEAGHVPGLELVDVILSDCGLANLDARGGFVRRVEIQRSRLTGFGLNEAEIADLVVRDSSLELSSFAGASLRSVRFEGVNLINASFMEARLELVEFVDCRLSGADFRGAEVRSAAIRGASLDGVLGVDSLRGARMPWGDVLASAGALAAALGIGIEQD